MVKIIIFYDLNTSRKMSFLKLTKILNLDTIRDPKLLKVLKALIFVLNIYPIHARYGLDEILKTGNTNCLSIFIVDDLHGKNDILETIIDLIDNEGREKTAICINAILPRYAAEISVEPLRTIWLKPPPYRGTFDERNSPL
jgi:hypothetical protein